MAKQLSIRYLQIIITLYLAIETVVKKRHERPNNKADNAGIIQLFEVSIYRLRMAGDSVVGGRH